MSESLFSNGLLNMSLLYGHSDFQYLEKQGHFLLLTLTPKSSIIIVKKKTKKTTLFLRTTSTYDPHQE